MYAIFLRDVKHPLLKTLFAWCQHTRLEGVDKQQHSRHDKKHTKAAATSKII